MTIEWQSFDLEIVSDYEDLLNCIVEDSLEKDGKVGHIQNVESEVNSHHHIGCGERNFKHNFDLNEVPKEIPNQDHVSWPSKLKLGLVTATKNMTFMMKLFVFCTNDMDHPHLQEGSNSEIFFLSHRTIFPLCGQHCTLN
jgi:hypothetical protein